MLESSDALTSLAEALVGVMPESAAFSHSDAAVAIAGLFGGDQRMTEEIEALLLEAEGDETLEMRPGGWMVNAGASVARAGLATTVLAALLSIHGDTDLPTYVLPAVIPLLFDVRSARLDTADKLILARLRASGDTDDVRGTLKSLYGSLPEDARRQLSELDFARFIDRLVAAGFADRVGDHRVTLRAEGSEVWLRISWR